MGILMIRYDHSDGIVVIDISGWWFQPTPLKNIRVNWDDKTSQCTETICWLATSTSLKNISQWG